MEVYSYQLGGVSGFGQAQVGLLSYIMLSRI